MRGPPTIPMTSARLRAVAVFLAVAAAVLAATSASGGESGGADAVAPAAERRPAPAVRTRTWTIHYRAHNGVRRHAYVLLPAWYGPRNRPPIPLIISPHGRGVTGRSNASIWGDLPARGPFAVINPDGHGRQLPWHSWGFAGQVDDLARMPEILRRALPWLQVDRTRIYAFGGSMGGQEALLLLARHPRLLAGVAAFDAVTDLARQYRRFPLLACNSECLEAWAEPIGIGLQRLAQREVGGPPDVLPGAYTARSPIAYARRLASTCVPLQFWWSVGDRVVTDQQRQSARLFWELRRLNRHAPVQAFVGFWIHTAEMHARSRLPLALAAFDLLADGSTARRRRLRVVPPPRSAASCIPRVSRALRARP